MFAKAQQALVLAMALAATGCRAAPDPAASAERPRLGLMTTLPLIWPEASDVGEMLKAERGTGWVRHELENAHTLEPLDTLDEASLAPLDRLVLAQPRALSPAENVALDAWVRRGGLLLLFADPMLTRHSRFPIGDRRRPQDVALLSPILAHWGLELRFDPDQGEGERLVEIEGVAVPVDLPGSFEKLPGSRCTLDATRLLARCSVGEGRLVALADAAVLDDAAEDDLAAPRKALASLLALVFP